MRRGNGRTGAVSAAPVTRLVGICLAALGAAALVWVGLVWFWQDPVTALYTRHEQRVLARTLDARTAYAAAGSQRAAARAYRLHSHLGEAMGRIVVPRLGLDAVVVDGTGEAQLALGPGFYRGDDLPGEGGLVYVAGHRTTYGAPFSHIERLRRGDRIALVMPYGRFVYRVTGHRIVGAHDIAVLRSRGTEQLILQSCHPRFSATHRYLVYARPAWGGPES